MEMNDIYADADPNEPVEIFQDGLLILLECPICYNILSSPVIPCENGHLICSYCSDRMDTCGTCRGQLLPNVPVPGVELLLEGFYLPCFHEEDGCQLMVIAADRRYHAETCIYRPIKCDAHGELPMGCENSLIDFRFYRSHMLEHHNMVHIDGGGGNTLEITFIDEDIYHENGLWPQPQQLFTFDGFTFIVRNFLENGNFCTWCSIIGTEIDAEQYRMNIYVEAPLDEPDEILEASKVELNLPIYSPHIQNLEDMTNAGFLPFRIPLHTLRLTDVVFGNVIEEEEVEGPGNLQYLWTVVYEFYKVPENNN